MSVIAVARTKELKAGIEVHSHTRCCEPGGGECDLRELVLWVMCVYALDGMDAPSWSRCVE